MSQKQLNTRQAAFVIGLSRGKTKKQAAIDAGYSKKYPFRAVQSLMSREPVRKALEDCGLTDKTIAEGIRENVMAGMGVKATASDSLRGLELASRLKGYLKPDESTSYTQNNVYINELKTLSDEELNDRLHTLQDEVQELRVIA